MNSENRHSFALIAVVLSLLALIVLPLTYTAQTRTLEECVFYSLIIGSVPVLLIITLHLGLGIRKALQDNWFVEFLMFKAIFFITFGGFFYYSILVVMHDFAMFLIGISTTNRTIAFSALITLSAGVVLHVFRTKQRLLYGLSEVVVGVVVAVSRTSSGQAVGQLNSADLYLAILTAGVFLIVRGLDNIGQGLRNRLDNRLITFLFGYPPNSESGGK